MQGQAMSQPARGRVVMRQWQGYAGPETRLLTGQRSTGWLVGQVRTQSILLLQLLAALHHRLTTPRLLLWARTPSLIASLIIDP